MPMVRVSNGGTPSTLTLIGGSANPISGTASIGDLFVFSYYSTGGFSYVTFTGLTMLSSVDTSSYHIALLQATATNISINNSATGTGGILAKIS